MSSTTSPVQSSPQDHTNTKFSRVTDTNLLITDLSSKDPVRRKHARSALVIIGKRAVPALISCLKHPNNQTRWEAAKTLGYIADRCSAKALIKALEDNNSDVRWLAAVALIALGSNSINPLLKALNDHPDSGELRQGAHHVFHDLSKSSWATALCPIMVALDSPEPEAYIPPAIYTTHKLLGKMP